MAIDTAAPRTRRAIIAGGLGGLAAWLASGLGRPAAVQAHDPQDVELGTLNTAPHGTVVQCLVEGSAALEGRSADGTGVSGTTAGDINNTYGVSGFASATSGEAAGVYGESLSTGGTGVYGMSPGTGVFGYGESDTGTGVTGYGGKYGVSGDGATGVFGHSGDLTAILGFAGEIDMGKPAPAPQPKTGVFGYSVLDASARGVLGKTTVGTGVRGEATSGTGVYATSATGAALAVVGKATFSRSKRVAIGGGKSSLKVTLAGVTTASLVFAVLHTNRTGIHVQSVVPSTGSFTIYLNKAVPSTTYVAYFVVN